VGTPVIAKGNGDEAKHTRHSGLLAALKGLARILLGALAFRVLRYLYRLWRQPALTSTSPAIQAGDGVSLRDRALSVATRDLCAAVEPRRLSTGQTKLVVNAGWRHFREPWARDFGFASYGLLVLGRFQAVRECLEAFLIYQKPNGQFPIKIHATDVVDRYLHAFFQKEQPGERPIRPKYLSGHRTVSLDGNALLVVAALNYARRSGDVGFVQTHWKALKRAVLWLEEYAVDEDGLLFQRGFADWADTVNRRGHILYTNVLYWKAVKEMAEAAPLVNDRANDMAAYLSQKADLLQRSIRAHFWRPDLGYYVTSLDFDNLSSAGNLLAIAWGLADPRHSQRILDAMERFRMAQPVPTRVVHRAYPRRTIALENRLSGLSTYHTDAAWLWLGAWHVIALARMGRLSTAQGLFERMGRVIVRDGQIHEVYTPDGRFLSRFWYTSEAPLTWSAGMVVYARHVLDRHQEAASGRGEAGRYPMGSRDAHRDPDQLLQADN
jgi:GH15 family glucan-1,4-alpha-glucosidase